MKVYLAAPLFSPTERQFNLELASILEPHFTVYLPQRDGVLVERLIKDECVAADVASQRAFNEDVEAIRTSQYLIAVLDGRTPDEGVCVEMGFARALGVSIVGFKSCVRVALPWGQNPMIDGCVTSWVSDMHELEFWAKNTVVAASQISE